MLAQGRGRWAVSLKHILIPSYLGSFRAWGPRSTRFSNCTLQQKKKHALSLIQLYTIKSYLMQLTTRSYGLERFWRSLVACWPSLELLRDYVCVCSLYYCSRAWGQNPVQRYVALVHAQAMCLRYVCVVLEALLAWRGVAWRGVAFQQRSVSLGSPPSLRFLGLGSPPSTRFFFLVSLTIPFD